MIQVYSRNISDRLKYTLDVVFKYILKTEYNLVSKKEDLLKEYPKLNYSDEEIEDSVQIFPLGLLCEEDVRGIKVEVDDFYFFKTSERNVIKYDLLSSSFFMLTRYEEYLYSEKDIHGRFKAEESLAYKNGFLKKAVVNRWANDIKKAILKLYTDYKFPILEFKYIPTFDIDIAFAYKAKGFKRLIGGGFRSLLSGDYEDLLNRSKYILRLQTDPFDIYEYLFDILEKNKLDAVFFFLVGKLGRFDKNISLESEDYKTLIKMIFKKYKVGLHPSYNSNLDFEILESEFRKLSNAIGKDINTSRQHYLKLTFPETYNNLLKLGLNEDYTLGFASQVGFRAGICTPYPFFDLIKNKSTELMLHPFQIMDGTLNQYLNLDDDDSFNEIREIVDEIKDVNGIFITLWHNETFSEMHIWKGWRRIFEKTIEISKIK